MIKKGAATTILNIAQIHLDENEIDSCILFANKALKYSKEVDHKLRIVKSLQLLGEAYHLRKDYSKAEFYFKESESIARQIGATFELYEILKNLSENNAQQNNFKEAVENLQEYSVLKDSLFDIEKIEIVEKYQAKYDLQKKEKEKVELESKLNKEKLKAANRAKMLGFTGFAATTFLLLFFWMRHQKQKEQTKRYTAEQAHELEETKRQLLEQKNTKLLQNKASLEKQLQTPEYFAQQTIFMTTNEKPVLKLGDIIYIQSHGNGVQVHTTNGNHFEWQSMKNMEEVLPDALFLRVHKSYLVNYLHISGRTARNIRLSDGTEVNIGAAYREKVEAFFGNGGKSEFP